MEKEPYSVRQAKALNFVSRSITRIQRDAPRKALELRAACESYHAEKLKEFDLSLTLKVYIPPPCSVVYIYAHALSFYVSEEYAHGFSK